MTVQVCIGFAVSLAVFAAICGVALLVLAAVRRVWSSKAEVALRTYTGEEQGTAAFREVAQKAQQTLTEIEEATESLRKFLAKQFKFTENF
jgi:hypothetical protein